MAGSAEEARTLHTIATGHEEPINDTQLDYYGELYNCCYHAEAVIL